MGEHVLLYDGEPDARAAYRACPRLASLVEGIEDAGALLARDARSLVGDIELERVAVEARGETDDASLRRKLHGIGQKVIEHDAQFFRISGDHHVRGGDIEGEAPRPDRESLVLGDAPDHFPDVHGAEIHGDLAELARAERKQVLDQLLQLYTVVAQDLRDLALLRGQLADRLLGQEFRALAQRRERRLQLVRDLAQEAVLLLLDFKQLAPHPLQPLAELLQVLRPVDCHRHAELARRPDGESPRRSDGSGA